MKKYRGRNFGILVQNYVIYPSPFWMIGVTGNDLHFIFRDHAPSFGIDSFLFWYIEVKILCHLHHDQLKAVFHVSQRIRRAVSLSLPPCVWVSIFVCGPSINVNYCWIQVCLARQFHFNYTTPDRSRQEMLSIMTPRVAEHWPFLR